VTAIYQIQQGWVFLDVLGPLQLGVAKVKLFYLSTVSFLAITSRQLDELQSASLSMQTIESYPL
jgi:hypothetical protein